MEKEHEPKHRFFNNGLFISTFEYRTYSKSQIPDKDDEEILYHSIFYVQSNAI